MLDLAELTNRVRALLDDPAGTRFSDTLLASAARHALAGLEERLPQFVTSEITISASGREQTVPGMGGCLHLVSLRILPNAEPDAEAVTAEFTYTLSGDATHLHFGGSRVPQAGEVVRLTCAVRHTLSGLGGALVTSIPEVCGVTLEFGTAGHACLLRAAALAERYGVKPGEAAQWLAQANQWLDRFAQALAALANLQEFGFPPGFALDQWDRKGR